MHDRTHPARLVFLCGPYGLGNAWRAMKNAYKSQMAWFRYGWIIFSRYGDKRLAVKKEKDCLILEGYCHSFHPGTGLGSWPTASKSPTIPVKDPSI